MALSSPGTSACRREYQVFLSFRGSDTRMGFVSHLYDKLHNMRGIRTFKDDQDLERGAAISPELLRAIEQSHFAIIVLSADYASSSWCLDELTRIVQSMEAGKILPVFYKVEPTIVRKQTGSFAQAFVEHETKFSQEKVKEWRAALKTVADLSGWHLDGNKSESDLIHEVVNCVWEQVLHTFELFDLPHKFVGRDFALTQLRWLLALDQNDVRFIGITGMGGIGKTTLAHRVCDIISHHFDFHCFLENVREVSAKDGTLVGLQNQLLFAIFKEKVVELWDARGRVISTREALRNKKILLVLDDVDHLYQLQKLVGEKDWFGNGSRIIITTRNQRLLIQHGIAFSYKVEGMSDDEALALFSLTAFKKNHPDEEFLELSKHFVNHAKGVPLVLQIWGSFLYQRDQDAWNSELINLQNIPHPDIFDSLKISYDGLREEEKSIFLEIACYHKGKHKQQVIGILDRRFGNISSLIVIDILIERSLLTMSEQMVLEMHDLIQEMAWEIIFRESKEEPGKRTRIWLLDDLRHVLMANTGTPKVEAIVVNSPKLEEIQCDSKAFSNMDRLRLIELDNLIIIPSGAIFLPHSLTIIHWSWYPSKFIPQSFHARYLTELSMPESKLVQLWDGRKDFPKLKIMDLSGSGKLTTTPDFTGMPNLEYLLFSRCLNLVDIHSSIGVLKRLKCLTLQYCESIEFLCSEFEMDSLEKLYLGYCSKLKQVPEFSEQMKNLTKLVLDGTAIEQLPSSVGNLVGLTSLTMRGSKVVQLWNGRKDFSNLKIMALNGCDKLTSLPDFTGIPNLEELEFWRCTKLGHIDPSIAVLKRLEILVLGACSKVKKIPEFSEQIKTLSELDLGGTAIEQLPSSIENLVGLTYLNLNGTAIEQLPSSIENLVNLTSLNLSGCKRLCVARGPLDRLRYLKELNLSDCNLGEGAIPEYIGCCSSLTKLRLGGNHFITLPASIQRLSELDYLGLDRCKRLRELPPLPPPRHSLSSLLYVDVENCTSLQRLTDPSLSSKFANLYDFNLYPLNCMRLVEDEGWINYVLSKMWRWITLDGSYVRGARGVTDFVYPGSDIPEWFINKSEEAGDWQGVAFCLVLSGNPATHANIDVRINCSSGFWTRHSLSLEGHLGQEHVTIFYRSRNKYPGRKYPQAAEAEFSFEATYYDTSSESIKVGVNMVKKLAARWVYKQDLKDLQQRLKIPKRTHEYYVEEPVPKLQAKVGKLGVNMVKKRSARLVRRRQVQVERLLSLMKKKDQAALDIELEQYFKSK